MFIANTMSFIGKIQIYFKYNEMDYNAFEEVARTKTFQERAKIGSQYNTRGGSLL